MRIIYSNRHKFMVLIIIFCIYIVFILGIKSLPSLQKFEYPLIETEYDIEVFLPSYIPNNFELKAFDISPMLVSVTFSSDDSALYFTQLVAEDFFLTLDTETNSISEYESEKFSGYLLTDQNIESSYLLYIYNDTNAFEIAGIIDKEDLFKIAESIEKYPS